MFQIVGGPVKSFTIRFLKNLSFFGLGNYQPFCALIPLVDNSRVKKHAGGKQFFCQILYTPKL
jgi:hypothetical protein